MARSCSPAGGARRLDVKQLRRLLERCGIAAVPHGFRSSFRDWAAEETDHPREVVEAALAHMVQNPVEAAYARPQPLRHPDISSNLPPSATCGSRIPNSVAKSRPGTPLRGA